MIILRATTLDNVIRSRPSIVATALLEAIRQLAFFDIILYRGVVNTTGTQREISRIEEA
jgi:hypothetical protein